MAEAQDNQEWNPFQQAESERPKERHLRSVPTGEAVQHGPENKSMSQMTGTSDQVIERAKWDPEAFVDRQKIQAIRYTGAYVRQLRDHETAPSIIADEFVQPAQQSNVRHVEFGHHEDRTVDYGPAPDNVVYGNFPQQNPEDIDYAQAQ